MKKIIFTLLSLMLLLVTGVRFSLAKNEVEASPFRVTKESVEERIETKKDRAEDRREGKRKENIAKYLQNMVAKLRAYVTRLETLISRIQSRFDKITAEDSSRDLSKIKTDLDKAKSILATIKDKITALEGMESVIVDSTTPKETFKDVRSKVESIKKDLKEVHLLLAHVIGNIKGLRVGESENETK